MNSKSGTSKYSSGKLPKHIEHRRATLVWLGCAWVETRKCKRCGVYIEIWRGHKREREALEVRPELEWKLVRHSYFCRETERKPEKPEEDYQTVRNEL